MRSSDQLVAGVARKCAVQVAIVEHQSTDTRRMSRRIGNGNRTALAQPNEGKAAKLERIDHGLEIGHQRVEGKIRYIPIGETGTSRVVANQRALLGQGC